MKAALLCPGPSLADTYDGPDGYDTVIAVNRVPIAIACDWWVFLDWHVFVKFVPSLDFTPGILTTRSCEHHIEHKGQGERLRKHVVRHTDDLKVKPFDWRLFSATSALVFASTLGATRIDCYGVDMLGDADWDGHQSERNTRTDTRWAREARLWKQTCELINAEVRRITT